MHRLLLLDYDGLLYPGQPNRRDTSWMPWLVEVLRPWSDVRIVLHSTGIYSSALPDRSHLSEMAPRLIGSTYGLPHKDALEAALRVNKQRVDHHLMVIAHSTVLPEGQFNILVCDAELGLSAQKTQAALSAWLWRTRPPLRNVFGARLSKGVGEHVLYLDFDGVLHHEDVRWSLKRGPFLNAPGHSLFEHAALLEDLLKPYPQVHIVLSTTWARVFSCYGAAKRLPPGLRDRVVGATWHSAMPEQAFKDKPRGTQVLEDVRRRRPAHWLALDDTDEGWPLEASDHVLITDEQLGISAPGMAERIAAALRRMHCL